MSLVLFERRQRVAIVTLNNPDQRNPLDADMVQGLIDAIEAINRDPEISCAILAANGPAFCGGGNVKEMRDRTGLFAGTPADMRRGYIHGIQRVPLAMYGLEVPSIAAVNGPAVGAGCDLAMMCDIRICAPTASFAESFLRVGLISGDGGAWFLPRVVGLSRAYEMAFTGNPITAEQGEKAGFISRVVPADQLLTESIALAERIAKQPPQALRMMKRLVRDGLESSLNQNLELAAAMQSLVQHTADHHEAVTAFLEKRAPKFTGR